jgi:hypothetical protein
MRQALSRAGDAGSDTRQVIVNDQALECRTQLCLQQSAAATIAHEVDTSALCTVDCRRDSDCEHGRAPRSGPVRRPAVLYCGVPVSTRHAGV